MILLPQALDNAARIPQPAALSSLEVPENSALNLQSRKVSGLVGVLSVHWTPGCHSFDILFDQLISTSQKGKTTLDGQRLQQSSFREP